MGCPERILPFWTSLEPVTWPWCNLAASQRRPYCASVNSHCPVGLVSRQWDAVDWACVLCDRRIQQWPSEQISFITTMCLPILQLSYRLFWQTTTLPRSVSPLQPRFGSPRLVTFPKAKIAVEREVICEFKFSKSSTNNQFRLEILRPFTQCHLMINCAINRTS